MRFLIIFLILPFLSLGQLTVTLSSLPEDESSFIEVCSGTTVDYTGEVDFNGGGGTMEEVTFRWIVNGNTELEALGAESFSWEFNEPVGTQVTLIATLENQFAEASLTTLVSPEPDFTTFEELNPSYMLLGSQETLSASFGGPGDLIQPGLSMVLLPAENNDTIPLPDGGASDPENPIYYESSVHFNEFDDGATLSSVSDIDSICLTMVHTYASDLEIWLTSPSQDTLLLVDGYDDQSQGIGLFPGGINLGGNNFGEGSVGPGLGIGYRYCFVPVEGLGNFEEALAADTLISSTIGSILAGNYAPQGEMENLVGSSLNGDWTFFIGDYFAADEGTMFQSAIYFNPQVIPTLTEYDVDLSETAWEDDPAVVSTIGSDILIEPTVAGDYEFLVNVVDENGCVFQRAQSIFVEDPNGLDELYDLGYSVNSTDNEIFISSQRNPNEVTHVEVFDISGKLIHYVDIYSAARLMVSPGGIYLLRLRDASGISVTVKVLVN